MDYIWTFHINSLDKNPKRKCRCVIRIKEHVGTLSWVKVIHNERNISSVDVLLVLETNCIILSECHLYKISLTFEIHSLKTLRQFIWYIPVLIRKVMLFSTQYILYWLGTKCIRLELSNSSKMIANKEIDRRWYNT